MAFAGPVVPEVNAINATSSCEGTTFTKASLRFCISRSKLSAASELKYRTWPSDGLNGRVASSSPASRASHSAQLGFGLVADLGKLARAQQRHGGDRDAARLEDGKPARCEHRIVRRTQQHTVAGNESHIVDQDAGDAIGLFEKLGITPRRLWRSHAWPLPEPLRHGAIEQLDGSIHPLRIVEPPQSLLIDDRPQLGRRKAAASEVVRIGTFVQHRRVPQLRNHLQLKCLYLRYWQVKLATARGSMNGKPPFRADHVGSLLRPQELIAARHQLRNGEISQSELREIEDRAIRDIVQFQEDIGLQAVTDGEFRRGAFFSHFVKSVAGMTVKITPFTFSNDAGDSVQAYGPYAAGKLKRSKGITTDEFKFVRELTDRTVKVTMPAPPYVNFLGGRERVDQTAYPDITEYFADLAAVYRESLPNCMRAGARSSSSTRFRWR